jgi:osmotically-inducible protein OsmY
MAIPTESDSVPDRDSGESRIRSSVEDRLQRSGYAALRWIWCEFEEEFGVLHLRGSVPSHYLKQVAQELVVYVEGVRLVNNQINVARSTPPRGGSAS